MSWGLQRLFQTLFLGFLQSSQLQGFTVPSFIHLLTYYILPGFKSQLHPWGKHLCAYARDWEEGEGELLNGYSVPVLQDENSSGDWLHNNVNVINTTEQLTQNGYDGTFYFMYISLQLNFFQDFIYSFLEGGKEGEKGRETCSRETSIGCLSHTPNWVGPGPQPRHVP